MASSRRQCRPSGHSCLSLYTIALFFAVGSCQIERPLPVISVPAVGSVVAALSASATVSSNVLNLGATGTAGANVGLPGLSVSLGGGGAAGLSASLPAISLPLSVPSGNLLSIPTTLATVTLPALLPTTTNPLAGLSVIGLGPTSSVNILPALSIIPTLPIPTATTNLLPANLLPTTDPLAGLSLSNLLSIPTTNQLLPTALSISVPAISPAISVPSLDLSLGLSVPTALPSVTLPNILPPVSVGLGLGLSVSADLSLGVSLPVSSILGQVVGDVSSLVNGVLPTQLPSASLNLPLTTDLLPLTGILPTQLPSVSLDVPPITALPLSGLTQLPSVAMPTQLPSLSLNLPLTTELPLISSLLGQVPGGVSSLVNGLVPTPSINLPLTTLLPNAVSSIVGQLPGDLSSLASGVEAVATNIPLTTILPNAVSSELGQLPGVVSSVVAGVVPTNLPITTLLPNGVSSILGQLPGVVSSLGDGAVQLPSLSLNLPLTTAIPLPQVTLPPIPSLVQDLITLPLSAATPIIPALLAGSLLPTPTPVSFSCPENNNQVIIENLLPYVLSCTASAIGSAYQNITDIASFNDCFNLCDTSNVTGGANYCTGFTYDVLEGVCVLENSVGQGLNATVGAVRIAAVRLVNFLFGGGTAPTVTVGLPTALPITTLLPNAVSSILGQVPGDISTLASAVNGVFPTNYPITTQLPNGISSVVSEVSSILSDLLNGHGAGPTNLPITTILPNGITSVVAAATGQISSALNAATPTQPLLSVPTAQIPTTLVTYASPIVSGTTALPTGGLAGLSSILAGVSNIPSGFTTLVSVRPQSSALNALSSGLVSNIAGFSTMLPPDTIPTSAAGQLSSLSSVLAGLSTIRTGAPISTGALGGNGAQYSSVVAEISSILNAITTASVSRSAVLTTGFAGASSALAGLSTRGLSLSTGVPPTALPNPSSGIASLSSRIGALSTLRASTTQNILPTVSALPSGVPTPTALPVFSCPGDTGLTYVNPSSQAFLVTCNLDYPGSDIRSALQPDMQTCLNTCGTVSGCTAAAFDQSTYTCYYKTAAGDGVQAQNYEGAAAVDLSCPGSNGAFYVDSFGSSYQILCNYSFPAGINLTTNAEISSRQDRTVRLPTEHHLAKRDPAEAVDMLECASTCSQTPDCVGVGIVGDACTLIGSFDGNAGGSSDVSDAIILWSKRVVTTNAAGQVVESTATYAAPSVVPSARAPLVINHFGVGGIGTDAGDNSTSTAAFTGPSTLSTVSTTAPGSVATSLGTMTLPSGGGVTPTMTTPTSACSRTRITTVVPVTTVWTTVSVAACSTNFLGQTACPSVSLTLSEIGSRTSTKTSLVMVTPIPSTFSTIRTRR